MTPAQSGPKFVMIIGDQNHAYPGVATWDPTTISLSLAYFCPACSAVWARLHTPLKPWMAVSRPCEYCPSSNLTPSGSILLPWNPSQPAELPLSLLRREFLLHLARYERPATS